MEKLPTGPSPSRLSSMEAHALEITVRRVAWRWVRECIASFVRKRIAARNARRALRELEAMSDRNLCDIGLDRADLERARGRPRSPFTSRELGFFDRNQW
jgi:uncharacterized protein YjiS (DUF1127 family)